MSGPSAIKGFLLQTLICVLETLEDKDWKSVIIEPTLDSEKVDIAWFYAEQKKVVQVKHSINQIGKSQVEKWVKELESTKEADEYELILLGPCSKEVARIGKIRNVQIPKPLNNSETAILEQASFKLDKFLEKENISLNASSKELFVKSLATDFLCNAIKSKKIENGEFLKSILNYVEIKNPIKRQKNPLERAINYLFDLTGWVYTSEQEFYYASFPEFRIIWESAYLRDNFFEHWIDKKNSCSAANMEIKLYYQTTVLKIFRAINVEERIYFPVPKYYDIENLRINGRAYILSNQIESFVCAIISKINTLGDYIEEFKLNAIIYSLNIEIVDSG
jgi:hypothetical protein